MNEDVLKLLPERYFLKKEKSWENLVNRVSVLHTPIKEYILNMEYISSTPTLMNTNTNGERKGTLSSCFPMDIEYDLEGIFKANLEAGVVIAASGGIGYDFSNLRSNIENISRINRLSS